MTEPLFSEDREKERKSKIFGTPEFRATYQRYINSSAWKKLRGAEVLRRANHKCERCGSYWIRLEIHHLSYERFQQELATDLEALCKSCHDLANRERLLKNQYKFEAAAEAARYVLHLVLASYWVPRWPRLQAKDICPPLVKATSTNRQSTSPEFWRCPPKRTI